MFPSTHKGLKKLLIAEILMIFAAFVGVSVTVLSALPEVIAIEPVRIVATVLGLVSVLVMLAAFILHMLGLQQAGKEDGYFRIAFWIIIFSILLSVAAAIVQVVAPGLGLVYTLLNSVADVCLAVVIVYVITGISNVATQLGRHAFAYKGKVLVYVILGLYLFAAVLALLSQFLGGIPELLVIFAIASIAASVFELVVYIIYLIYLAQATLVIK